MANEANFAVSGYVATQPRSYTTKDGTPTLSMRVAWTPRVVSKVTGEWTDQPTSFVSVTCYRKVAENAAKSLRKGDPIVLRGTLKVREYADQAGAKRTAVDVVADSLGHDLSKGSTHYTKAPRHSEKTAEEYDSSTAVERNPLPGDVVALASEDGDDVPRFGDPMELPADDADDDDAGMLELLEPPDAVNDRPDAVNDRPDAVNDRPDAVNDRPDAVNDRPDVKLASARARRR
jgi:single-strand DNA-binding protein